MWGCNMGIQCSKEEIEKTSDKQYKHNIKLRFNEFTQRVSAFYFVS